MRNLVLQLASGDELSVRHFSILESISSAFTIDLIARGRDDVDLRGAAGHHASFQLNTDHGSRIWTGVCASISQTRVEPEGLSTYSLRLAPALWMLTHRRNHRVFQHLSVPQIAKKLLHDWKIEPALKMQSKLSLLEHRVQYGETDYDFLRRLLVEAGISFYFDTDDHGKTRLVLSDAPQSNPPHREAPVPFHRDTSNAGDHRRAARRRPRPRAAAAPRATREPRLSHILSASAPRRAPDHAPPPRRGTPALPRRQSPRARDSAARNA